MLLKIRVHGPDERPTHSCKALVATKIHDLHDLHYSKEHNAWNVKDEDEDAEYAIDPKDYFIGWIYEDEIFWQIVCARREADHEV